MHSSKRKLLGSVIFLLVLVVLRSIQVMAAELHSSNLVVDAGQTIAYQIVGYAMVRSYGSYLFYGINICW